MSAPAAACGIVLLDKPAGLSSHSATQRVKRLLGAQRAGHVGSLDPLATGMLPICIGEATKVAGQIVEGAKLYAFTIALGARTATGDLEGEVVERAPLPPADPATLGAVLRGFVGPGTQIPPMYSAIKVDGQPLYRLARRGQDVERAARPIEIHALDGAWSGGAAIDCTVRCAKGLYVRVLAEDIARALGSCGHVAALRRLQVEPFDPEAMRTLEQLAGEVEAARAGGAGPALLAADQPLGHLPAIDLDAEATRRIHFGQAVPVDAASAGGGQAGAGAETGTGTGTGAALVAGEAVETVRLYGPGRLFLGLGRVDAAGRVHPKRLWAPAS